MRSSGYERCDSHSEITRGRTARCDKIMGHPDNEHEAKRDDVHYVWPRKPGESRNARKRRRRFKVRPRAAATPGASDE